MLGEYLHERDPGILTSKDIRKFKEGILLAAIPDNKITNWQEQHLNSIDFPPNLFTKEEKSDYLQGKLNNHVKTIEKYLEMIDPEKEESASSILGLYQSRFAAKGTEEFIYESKTNFIENSWIIDNKKEIKDFARDNKFNEKEIEKELLKAELPPAWDTEEAQKIIWQIAKAEQKAEHSFTNQESAELILLPLVENHWASTKERMLESKTLYESGSKDSLLKAIDISEKHVSEEIIQNELHTLDLIESYNETLYEKGLNQETINLIKAERDKQKNKHHKLESFAKFINVPLCDVRKTVAKAIK